MPIAMGGAMNKRTDNPDTMPLDLGGQVQSTSNRISFVFYLRGDAKAVTLLPGDSYVAGRSTPSEIELDDPSVSREHARISIAEDGTIEVIDLDSMNGTFVNGERVERATLGAGDQLALGAVLVGIHRLAPGAKRLRGLESHDTFFAHLKDEVERARQFDRPLAVLLARVPTHVDEVVSAVVPRLRRVDRAARYANDIIEILLPEMGPAEVEAFARSLVDETGLPLSVGFATVPAGGRNGDELLGRAREALADKGPSVRSGNRDAAAKVARSGEPLVLNAKMRALYDTVSRAARSTIPVLIRGETGTGKELVARALHDRSSRSAGEIIFVNCGALPAQLIEATLFGAEKGAYTGANAQRVGVFEAASGGTVFLDEIGELPLEAQATLLRVLETGRITRVGATREINVDVRIVAATHRNLDEMVEDGAFRQDLLFRLNAMTLEVPPLRDRTDEILPLARRFLEEAGSDLELADDAIEFLESYRWPGNIRELKNALQRAMIVASGGVVTALDLPDRVRKSSAAPVAPAGEETGLNRIPDALPDYRSQERAAQRRILLAALEATSGNQSEAARKLQMPLRTFVHKMKSLGIKRDSAGYVVDDAE